MTRLLYETIQFSPFLCDGDVPLVTQFQAAADAGFDGVGVDVWSIQRHLDRGGTVEQLVRAVDDAGLECIELQAMTVGEDDPPCMRPASIIDLVSALHPEVVMAGFVVDPDPRTLETMRAAVEAINARGARVAVEFLPTMALDSIAKTRRAIADVGGHIGVCVDTWHFFRGPSTWADLEALPVEELAHVQFNDALPLESHDLMSEMLHRRALPGEGEFDLHRFCTAIREKGYAGPVAVELMSAPLRALGPHQFARQALAAARPYWS